MRKKNGLREERERQGLSLLALSRKSGIPWGTIQAIETDRMPGRPVVQLKLAEALKVEPLSIFPELSEILDFVSGQGYVIVSRKGVRK